MKVTLNTIIHLMKLLLSSKSMPQNVSNFSVAGTNNDGESNTQIVTL